MVNEFEENESFDELDSLPTDQSPVVVPSWALDDWAQPEVSPEAQMAEIRADEMLENDSLALDDAISELSEDIPEE